MINPSLFLVNVPQILINVIIRHITITLANKDSIVSRIKLWTYKVSVKILNNFSHLFIPNPKVTPEDETNRRNNSNKTKDDCDKEKPKSTLSVDVLIQLFIPSYRLTKTSTKPLTST